MRRNTANLIGIASSAISLFSRSVDSLAETTFKATRGHKAVLVLGTLLEAADAGRVQAKPWGNLQTPACEELYNGP